MKRKRWVIAAIALVLAGGYTAGIYGQTEQLTQKQISNPDNAQNQSDIAKNVLESTGRSDDYNLNDVEKVTVYYGNVQDLDESYKDVVISVNFGPKNTVVAVYTPNGEVYEYVADVGNFYNVENIQFVPLQDLGKEVIVIQEQANQQAGGLEDSTFLRGYIYEGGQTLENVLHTPIQIDATWNDIWEEPGVTNEANWRRVQDKAQPQWNLNGGSSPTLDLSRYQEYLISQGDDSRRLPEEEEFVSQSKRIITERIYWSPEWKRFLIGEAIEKATGAPVAVLENRDNSPYVLAGFVENSYLIERQDGTQEILPVDQLEWTRKPTQNVNVAASDSAAPAENAT